ncbi:dTMP kinase [Candidatus Aminicenantes bacterium AC-335-K20]|jgi:dTMP kinase|nr:dTMP kinase [SCandidatus Aminicenantes bacterium Aminicenantia_JdfR_composite]MCP2597560.1 dTMP kinase [Candidatus Aminicenantes bacterium AC-335-G13]MCP2606321.1 dTMP kinase [Candidatus Aminicenantes bacterium AC-708-I09]MCP2617978.1 dTMP kinase [Candidatus Aminicenantes bacterium AC-335-A11]MCP2619588.1 dTMP kinase [Candidatus Aminicenantes bacterium AC-335-K20]
MSKKLEKGILIVFEGIDGCGKSTQAKLLFEKLRSLKFDCILLKEPSSGKWGKKIKKLSLFENSISPEEELELFVKDREENTRENIKPALQEKRIVILDRYYFSTIAYQGAKGINLKYIENLNKSIAIEPDIVFILDVEPSVGLSRIENRKKKEKLFEREDYLNKVRRIYNSLKGKNIIKMDGSQKIDKIREKIEEIVLKYIEKYIDN